MPEILNIINDYSTRLKTATFKDISTRNNVNDQIKIINEQLKPKQDQLPNLLNRIVEKEGKLAKRLSLDESSFPIEGFYSAASESRLDSEASYKNSFRESKLVVKDLVDNTEYLKKRQAELEDIKKVSSQVKSLSEMTKNEVKKQGEGLKSIEQSVSESNTNAKKAELEILEAEKITRKSNSKILCIVLILILVVVSIIVLLLLLSSNNNKK
jgi:hypothetical protein